MRIRGWVALLAVAGSANVSCVLAQGSTIYKCTDSDGRTSFSDQPCAMTAPGAAGSAGTGRDGVRQEVVRQPKPSASIDPCFEKTPVCPGGRLDPAANCCPQACKDAYRRERAAGTDPVSALVKVLFGDEAGAVSCIPGMPRRG